MRALLLGTAAAATLVAASPAIASTGTCSTAGTSFKSLTSLGGLSCSKGKSLAKAADNKGVYNKQFTVQGYSCLVNKKNGKPSAGYCKRGSTARQVTWFYKS